MSGRRGGRGADGDRRESVAPIDLVSRIQRIEGDLSAAERRVAAAVAADYEATTRMTIRDLANRAGVSQPSVTRFCRSVGCASFGEFKVRLATTLTVAAVYLRTDRVFEDDIGQLAQVVMIRAANAIRDCLERLDTGAVGRAIAAIAGCNRLDIYGQGGGSASIAEDAKLRFFRLGLPVCAYSDGHQQRMSAATLRPKDVAFAVSNSGRSKPVVGAIEIARSYGARTDRSNAAGDAACRRCGDRYSRRHSRTRQRADADRFPLRPYGGDRHHRHRGRIRNGRCVRAKSLRRVRYTLANIGVAIPSPSSDPTPLMKTLKPQE